MLAWGIPAAVSRLSGGNFAPRIHCAHRVDEVVPVDGSQPSQVKILSDAPFAIHVDAPFGRIRVLTSSQSDRAPEC
jgi:hypothetical protein